MKRKPGRVPKMLPSHTLTLAGVPDDLRPEVAYRVLAAKYVALVEAVMKITGGKGVEVSLERTKHLVSVDVDDPPETKALVLEEGHLTHGKHGIIRVRLATVDEIIEADAMEREHRRRIRGPLN